MFTVKNIRQVRKGWLTIDVIDAIEAIESRFPGKGPEKKELHIDLAVSQYDHRDWIISSRSAGMLDQDGEAVIDVLASKRGRQMFGSTRDEMKARLIEIANEKAGVVLSLEDERSRLMDQLSETNSGNDLPTYNAIKSELDENFWKREAAYQNLAGGAR